MVLPGSAASALHALGNIFRRRQKRRAGSARPPRLLRDVSLTFAAKVTGFRVIAVEPDTANRAVLAESLRGLARAEVLDCALAAEDGAAAFSEGYGFASRLSAFGQVKVSTRSIDSLDVEPTFIKLHLEGGEHDALRGARETLRAQRPDRASTCRGARLSRRSFRSPRRSLCSSIRQARATSNARFARPVIVT